MKKIFCLLISVLLVLAAGTAMAQEDSSWDFDAVNYSLDGYTGPGGDLVIPDMIQECTVDIIGLNAFNAAGGITSLTLPGTLRQIEDGAISFCDDLTAVTLNEGLLVIGDNCFVGNPALTEITFPASVCYIGNYSFNDCSSLTKIVFEGKCPVFAGEAFDWLPEDAVIYVPDDQQEAYSAVFEDMGLVSNLQPSGMDAVEYDFSCDPDQFGFDPDTGTLLFYEGFDVRVDIPAQIDGVPVTAIDTEAFWNRQYLCYLTLPEGVEIIGDGAFEDCTRLLYIDFPSTLKSIGNRAFAGGLQAWRVDLPEGLESIGSEAFDYAIRLSGTLELPQSLKTIGERAFTNCSWLEAVTIPASVEKIGENAFSDSGLTYACFEGLELPEMPESVFADCPYLADIDLHTKASKQQMLDLQAVVDGIGLECRVWRIQNPEVNYIEDGLDVYENNVMTGYSGQQTHIRPWDIFEEVTITALGDGAFKGNEVIQYFSVPYSDAFTTIGAEAFAGSKVQQVDLFDSVTTIGAGAFRDCTELTELVLPQSVTSVGDGALQGCTGLKRLTVLCDPTILPEDLLAGCPKDLEVYAAADATDEQVKYLSRVAGRAFYDPVLRLGEEPVLLLAMPDEPLPGEDFWYDSEYARLDTYDGYELNLILPWQIDDTLLTMLGGGVMTRAAYGDDYEAELPVVSVVIPETYTEIVPYAFANCETLETVICYAPIEEVPDCLFQNCTALREVVFVNGVHSIGQFVFDNCPALETVYVGPYAEYIDEMAFMNSDGTTAFEQTNCITDPALLPDVEALLEAVKRDPMPEPEPEPVAIPVPVGEEGAPFVGVWHGTEMVMGETTYSLSEFDMIMTAMISEEGWMIISDSETIDISLVGEGDWIVWQVVDGKAITDEGAGTMIIAEDGRLCMEDEDMQVYFERDEAAIVPPLPISFDSPAEPAVTETPGEPDTPDEPNAPAVDSPADTPAANDRFEIKFVCVNADVDGNIVDASLLGGEYSLVFHADGTADFVLVGTALPALPWTESENGSYVVDYYGTAMEAVWTEDGFDLNYFDTMLMHFVPES